MPELTFPCQAKINRPKWDVRHAFGVKEKPAYWLDDARKAALGRRIASELHKKKMKKAWLAERLECSRAQVTLICQKGGISLEMLTEIAVALNLSLDYLVLGKFPTSDPEFQATLTKLMSLLPEGSAVPSTNKKS